MGPAAVALSMQGPWVFGALANQQWSFAGWGDKDVSAMLIQPFVNYNLPDGMYLVSAPSSRRTGRPAVAISGPCRWVGAGEAVQARQASDHTQLQAFYNVERPHLAADWQLRFQLQFLFPK